MKASALSKNPTDPKLETHRASREAYGAPAWGQLFGQSSTDLIQDQPHQRLGKADIRRWYDQVKGRGTHIFDEIPNLPVALSRHVRHHGVTGEPEKRHRSG